IGELGQTFELRRFTFDSRVAGVRDFQHMRFDGIESAIGGALRELARRFEGRPLAAGILFTDGIATDNAEELVRGAGLPPVYPVRIGHQGTTQDLALKSVAVTQSAFEDAPVAIRAEVVTHGWRGREVGVRLIDENCRQIMELTQTPRKETETLTFNFRWRPEKTGLFFYQVEVFGRGRESAGTSLPESVEATPLNNTRTVAVERRGGPCRVLYVGGRPNWEYKYLKRALEGDESVQLVGMIRVAKREPKFEFMGRAGETGNPLFRGFGDQSRETTERYDQPVLLRLGTRDEHELASGFPRTAEELYEYHGVILDDIEAEFFDSGQLGLIRSFVAERGGGLLMLGGVDSFGDGGWARTPVASVLPVYLEGRNTAAPGQYRLSLTREGLLEPWARLRDNERDEELRRAEMPVFGVLNIVGSPKPGATLIARAVDARGAEYPAIVTQKFGRGRAVAVAVGDIWRWGMQSPETRADMEKFWRQLVRWLTADVPLRIETTVEADPKTGPGTVRINTRVRDRKFEPVDGATVTMEIKEVAWPASPKTNATPVAFRVRAEPSDEEPGLYAGCFTARKSGVYYAEVIVADAAGKELGRTETGWSVDLAAAELRSTEPDPRLLEAIAKATGGEVIDPGQLEQLARRLPGYRAPVMETMLSPIWHTPWMFVFAVGCLITEWWLRRRHGLP
ncbi:MAG: glutamine amidotransferase, partial [Verrucomicrobiae bacterium]|nr:glutamine amidotransferase [Verrucomicrobiae bacterium]